MPITTVEPSTPDPHRDSGSSRYSGAWNPTSKTLCMALTKTAASAFRVFSPVVLISLSSPFCVFTEHTAPLCRSTKYRIRTKHAGAYTQALSRNFRERAPPYGFGRKEPWLEPDIPAPLVHLGGQNCLMQRQRKSDETKATVCDSLLLERSKTVRHVKKLFERQSEFGGFHEAS